MDKDKEIKFIDVVEGKDGDYISAKITFKDGSSPLEVSTPAEVYSKIAEFAKQEKCLPINLLEDETKMNVRPKDKEESDEDDEEDIEKKGKKVKDKSSNRGLKIFAGLSCVTAVGLAVVMVLDHFGVFKNANGVKLNQTGTPKPKDAQEDIMPTNVPTTMPTSIPTVAPTVAPSTAPIIVKEETGIPLVQNGSKFNENLENIYNESNLQGKIERIITHDPMSNKEFFNILDDINMELSSNINEVCNLVDGGRMTGVKWLLHYETMFPEGSYEYDAVKRFCGLRNDVVHNAYYQDPLISKLQVSGALDEFIGFLYKGKTYNLNGKIYGFNDLNPQARYFITVLCQKVLEINANYETTIEGREWSQSELRDATSDFFSETVMVNLTESVNKSY